MLKVFDLLRSLGWYLVSFIYDLIDGLLQIIKKLNAFDIIDTLSNNDVFKKLYSGIIAIAITLFALFIVWKFINKLIDPDEEATFKNIFTEIVKCGVLIMMTTFLFSQVSTFSIALANYTGNIFEANSNNSMSDVMLSMFISYKDGYKNSEEFKEDKTIDELITSNNFDKNEAYLEKYVTEAKIIFADDKDYKYEINWLMAVLTGGFFLYSLFFAGIMLGRRQIEFLFLFAIAPVVFATSICNKQRRGAVIEQLVSLALQSAVVMLIVTLGVMAMQEINKTTFFDSAFMNVTTKSLLYLGCATFIMTGSQVINRFIGANVSSASGREQLMSLMGYGKMAGIGATVATGAAVGGGLLATGASIKSGKTIASEGLTRAGLAIGSLGVSDTENSIPPTKMQKVANALGAKMYTTGSKIGNNINSGGKKSKISDSLISSGSNSLNHAIKTVMPRQVYNKDYYRRRNKI